MSYDGFYGDLSTRGTANEALGQITVLKDRVSILAAEAEVSAIDSEVSATTSGIKAAASVASAASALSSKNAAETSEVNAGFSEEQAVNSATAAALSETNAAESATTATSAKDITLTQAAISSDAATTASASATTATTKAAEAAASALAALNSQTAAKTSETNAKASETAALPAIVAGLRFCGVSTTAPTTRTNGTALQVADEYHNSGDKLRYTWSGTAWVALNSIAQQLEERLADDSDPVNGAYKVGVYGTGKNLQQILDSKVFPGIKLGLATTSWANIVSANNTDDQTVNFQNLTDMHPEIIVDTRVAINDTITLSRSDGSFTCTPLGEILAGPGMAQKTMLKVTGHQFNVNRPRMDNPDKLKSTTGGRQTAISIQADNVIVQTGVFKNMLHAITTDANGEWYNPQYLNNLAYECLGVGAGPNDDGSTSFGESRGDAFLIWGATGKMIGNTAICGDGQDARVAFHWESLGNQYHTRPNNPARDGHDLIMAENIAIGSFRRHFVFESSHRGLMHDCISAGGATWWPVCIVGGSDHTVHDMNIYYDRMPTNHAGAAWAPAHAGIMTGQGCDNIDFHDIKIRFAPGAAGAGVSSAISNIVGTNMSMSRVEVLKPVGSGGIGFLLDKLTDIDFNDNTAKGVDTGLTTFGNFDGDIRNFVAEDILKDGMRFLGGGGSIVANIRVEGGRVVGAQRAVATTNCTTVSIDGLKSKTISGNDLSIGGTTGAIAINGCHNEGGTGKIVGITTPFDATVERYIGDNPGYSYNFKVTVASISSATSTLNTKGKHTGKTVIAENGLAYISSGSSPTAPWIRGETLVTPA